MPSADYVIQPVSRSHVVRFAPGESRLPPPEATRLQAFLATNDPAHSSGVGVAATGPLAPRRIAAVTQILNRHGAVNPVLATDSAPADQAIVTVSRNTIIPAACLSEDPWPTPDMPPPACTNALNLLHSVENIADLGRGRTMGAPPAGPVARAAERYLLLGGQGTVLPGSSFDETSTEPSASSFDTPVGVVSETPSDDMAGSVLLPDDTSP